MSMFSKPGQLPEKPTAVINHGGCAKEGHRVSGSTKAESRQNTPGGPLNSWDEMLKKYQVPCLCGGAPQKVKTDWASTGYHHVECGACHKTTCTDTNDVVIWQDWAAKNRQA